MRRGRNDTVSDKLIVQKSQPLLSLWRSDFTLPEFKILDAYLAKIDSRKPGKRTVTFAPGELEKLLGISKINKSELRKRLLNLHTPVELPKKNGGLHHVSLFEETEADPSDGENWKIKLTCTTAAKDYFFNVEQIGYLRYRLRCIAALGSRYAYILFLYLEANRFRSEWEIPLVELKKMLKCEKNETYKEYYRFNELVLKRAKTELETRTECRFDYEPIRDGRTVVAVRFTVKALPAGIAMDDGSQIEGQMNLSDLIPEEPEEKPEQRELPFWAGAAKDLKLREKQIWELDALITTVPAGKLPEDPNGTNDLEIRQYHYILVKTTEIMRRDEEKPIRSKFAYLRKLIEKDKE